MPEIRIKTPNLDDIFEKWKQRAVRSDKKNGKTVWYERGYFFFRCN